MRNGLFGNITHAPEHERLRHVERAVGAGAELAAAEVAAACGTTHAGLEGAGGGLPLRQELYTCSCTHTVLHGCVRVYS